MNAHGWTAMLLSCLSGCAHQGPARPTPAPDAPGGVTLQATAFPDGAGQQRGLSYRDTLHGGDRFTLRIGVEAPAYLYVWHRGSAGRLEVLFPAPGQQAGLSLPGVPVMLPAPGLFYRLDDRPGKESFYVVATRDPQGPASLGAIAAGLPGEREPPTVSPGNRTPGPVYRRIMDRQGRASLPFVLIHQ